MALPCLLLTVTMLSLLPIQFVSAQDLGIFLNADAQGLYTSELNDLTDFRIEQSSNTIGLSRSIKYDPGEEKIYVASWGEDKIQRLNRNGADLEELVTSLEGPYGLAVDIENRIVYWTEYQSTVKTGINYINMDGTGQGEVPNTVFGPKSSRVLDFGIETGFIYIGWTNNPQIRRFSHDGTTNEILIAESDGISDPVGMAVNEAENKLYWSDRSLKKIEIYDLQTSSRTVLFQGINSGDPRGIAEYKGYLYFFDGGSPYRIALDGSDTTPELLTYALQGGGGSSSLNSVWDLVMHDDSDTEMPTITGIPSAIITTTDANSASAVVSWTDPTATDNFGAVTLTSDATSGSNFPIGTTTVTFTATDPRGNQATAFFTITVTDLGIFLNSDVMGLYTSKLNNLTMRTDFSIERLPNRIGNSRSIKYDPDDKKIYVASWGEDKIFRLKPDGTDFEEFLTSVEGPYGLALDLENRIVYWTDFGSSVKTGISYINMDGTGQGEVPNSVFGPRQARVLDFGTETGFIYIGWILGGPQIRRFSHDGTTNEVLIADSDGISDPTGMVVNEAENKLYWSDRVLMKIEIYDLQTSSRTVLFQGSNSGDPRGIAEFKGYLYFFDGGSSYRIALDGSDTTPELLTYALQEGGGSSNLNSVWDLVLYNSDDSERPTITGTPSSINTTTDVNSATAVVSWTDPTASDNSGFVTLTSDATSGSKFSYGTTTVTFTATDPSGNQATDFFTITVAALPCISGIRLKQRYSTNTNSYLLTWSEPRFLRGDIWCESDEVQVHDVSSVMGSSHNYTRPWQTENSLELVLLDGVDNYTIEVTPRNTSADGQSAVEGESYFIKAIQVYPVIVDAYAGGMTFNVSIDVDVTLIDWTIELNFRRQVFKLKMENSTVDILFHNEKIKRQSRWGGYSSTCTITTGPEYQTLNSGDTLDIQMTANVWKQLRPEGDYVTGMMTQVYTISGGG